MQADATVRHEKIDARGRTLAFLAGGLFLLVALSAIALFFAYPAVQNDLDRRPAATPPQLRLQAEPREDYLVFARRQLAERDGWGWTDRARGRIREPVAVAMRRLARDGEAEAR